MTPNYALITIYKKILLVPYKQLITSTRASFLSLSTVFKLSLLDTAACNGAEKVRGVLPVCSRAPFTLKTRIQTFPLIRSIVLANTAANL